MSQSRNESRVKLDLNNEIFQQNLLGLDKTERNRVLDTLKKLLQLTWNQVYCDQGLNPTLTPPSNTPLGRPHGAKHSAREPKSVCI